MTPENMKVTAYCASCDRNREHSREVSDAHEDRERVYYTVVYICDACGTRSQPQQTSRPRRKSSEDR